MTDETEPTPASGIGRRGFIRAGGLVTGGLAVGGAAGAAIGHSTRHTVAATTPVAATTAVESVAFYGAHQPGVTGRQPASMRFTAYDLTGATRAGGAERIRSLLSALSAAAASMMAGRWIAEQGDVADGLRPAGLTVTFGFGSRLIAAAGRTVPGELTPLPAFTGEQLDPARGDGDLAVAVCAEDPLVVSSVARALTVVAGAAVTTRWVQTGFSPSSAASTNPTATPRNLLGQLDGTDNPTGSRLEIAVWVPPGTGWMAGGSYLVTRRIRMLLDTWARESTAAKEKIIGRKLISGAPLSGGTEHDNPVFTARTSTGALAIAADAHVRLTHPANNTGATMLRRGFSYDEGVRSDGRPDAGLFFQAFQTDPRQVFVPIQRKLAASDALGEFIRHEASAVFAIPPGASPGGYVGETLFA